VDRNLKVVMKLYFDSFIGKKENAEMFFKLLEKYGLLPEKIGLYEPIRHQYTLDIATEYWTKSEKGNGREIGGIMGKRKKPDFSFMMEWNRGEKYIKPCSIFISVHLKEFKRNKDVYLFIFKTLLLHFKGIYGYISTEDVEHRQFVQGTLETRLPGIFWTNYFGQVYVEFFEKKNLLDGPWYSIEEMNRNSVIVTLSKEPDDLEQDETKEKEAKKYLGINSFGDRECYLSNIDEVQIKNVPKLELRELKH
jgi:hypothetical protein